MILLLLLLRHLIMFMNKEQSVKLSWSFCGVAWVYSYQAKLQIACVHTYTSYNKTIYHFSTKFSKGLIFGFSWAILYENEFYEHENKSTYLCAPGNININIMIVIQMRYDIREAQEVLDATLLSRSKLSKYKNKNKTEGKHVVVVIKW